MARARIRGRVGRARTWDLRGQSALVDLSGQPVEHSRVPGVALQHVAFDERHPDKPDQYPNSLMGCIALVRQTLLDAGWYRQAHAFYTAHPGDRPETNEALAALDAVVTGRVEAACIDDRPVDLSNRQTRLYDKYQRKYAP